MTNLQIEEVRVSLFEFYNLEQTLNETVLSMIEKQFSKYDFDICLETLLSLGGKDHKIFSIADALSKFSDHYRIIRDKQDHDRKLQEDLRHLSYTAFEDSYTPQMYRPCTLSGGPKCIEARAFVVYHMLVRHKYLNSSMFGEAKILGISGSVFQQTKTKFGDYLKNMEDIDLQKAADYVKELAGVAIDTKATA